MSMHELSLAAGTLPEFSAEVVARAAGEAGFRMAGFTVSPEQWEPAMTRRVENLIRRWQLDVLDVEVVWIPEGGGLDDGHRLIVDVAAALEARNLLVVSSEPDVARSADALHRLCEWAAPAGMRVALEFLMIAAIRSLDTALQVVRACDHPAAAVLVDALHLQRAGQQPADLRALPASMLPYVQLCDGRLRCGETRQQYLEDALDLRSAPGDGELPLRELVDVLPEDCPLSLEVRSRHYRETFPEPIARAAAVRRRTLEFLGPSPHE